MTDTGIFTIGVVVMAITLAGTLAGMMSGFVDDDPPEIPRPRPE